MLEAILAVIARRVWRPKGATLDEAIRGLEIESNGLLRRTPTLRFGVLLAMTGLLKLE
jgi:hypothetical protein